MNESLVSAPAADGSVRLLLSRCECGAVAFPPRSRCAACSGTNISIVEAPGTGTVFSWTTMPGTEPPRVVGMVKLSDGAVVQGYIAAPRESMRVDLPVRSVAAPIPGSEDAGYAFEPIEGAES
jgi:uncharacterized OB-fold protein